MITFKAVILWLHLTTVVVWVGGMFFMTLVLLPMLRCSTSSHRDLFSIIDGAVKRFQTISWEAVGIILLTGIFNLINVGLERDFNFSAAYIHIVATKFFLLIIIIAIQSFQSYNLLPGMISRLSSGDKLPAGTDSFDKFRKRTMLLSIPKLLLAGLVIYLGLSLEYR